MLQHRACPAAPAAKQELGQDAHTGGKHSVSALRIGLPTWPTPPLQILVETRKRSTTTKPNAPLKATSTSKENERTDES